MTRLLFATMLLWACHGAGGAATGGGQPPVVRCPELSKDAVVRRVQVSPEFGRAVAAVERSGAGIAPGGDPRGVIPDLCGRLRRIETPLLSGVHFVAATVFREPAATAVVWGEAGGRVFALTPLQPDGGLDSGLDPDEWNRMVQGALEIPIADSASVHRYTCLLAGLASGGEPSETCLGKRASGPDAAGRWRISLPADGLAVMFDARGRIAVEREGRSTVQH